MNILKNSLFLVLAMTTLFLTSCKKDDCTAPDVAENIIGTWTASYGEGTVEFKTGGVLVDPSDLVISGEINGDVLDQKTYSATNDSLYVRAESATTTNFVDATFPVSKNECDKISISVFGVAASFNRQ